MKSVKIKQQDGTFRAVGNFDGEYFYTNPKIPFRVDDGEVYKTTDGSFVGYYQDGVVTLPNGSPILYVE
jgi:hypothetical protein